MKVAWYEAFGEAEAVLQCGEAARPDPGPGEVRVRMACSGINPVDVKRRLGGRGDLTASRVVPHFDGAGTIDAVGEGIGFERVGQRVWLYEAQWQRDLGTASEFITLPSHLAVPLPEAASFHDGASLGVPALTAWQCVFGDGPVDGQTILVTGGAGAVGLYAVQFAALSGARVISTVSGEQKAEIARAGGADATVNYQTESVHERVLELTDGGGVDRVVEVDFGSNLSESIASLKPRGVIATYASAGVPEPRVPFYVMMYRNITVRTELVFLMTDDAKRAAIADLGGWLSESRLVHPTPRPFAFDDIAEAHRAVESGAVGKVVLEIDA